MTAPLVHILGCGRTARALARVLLDCGAIRIGRVVNRSLDSARAAVAFMGAGEPAATFDDSIDEGWLLLGLPDGQIEAQSCRLAETLPGRPQLAFHLSGSIPSKVLAPITGNHAAVHPLRAFADPTLASAQFAGTWCVAEGERRALDALRSRFEQGGARWVEFAPRDKAAWHAATVAASNYLVVINALARDLAVGAGIDADQARRMLADLQAGTITSLAGVPAAMALTGPFERADLAACTRLRDAADSVLEPHEAELFATLARASVALAQQKRGRREDDVEVTALFSSPSSRPG